MNPSDEKQMELAKMARLAELAYYNFAKLDMGVMSPWEQDVHRLTVAFAAMIKKDKKYKSKANPEVVVNQLLQMYTNNDAEPALELQRILDRIKLHRNLEHELGIKYDAWEDVANFCYKQNKIMYEKAFTAQLNKIIQE